MKVHRFLSGICKKWTDFLGLLIDQFDNQIDDVVLRVLVLLRPGFIDDQPWEDIFNPRNPTWFMSAALNRMQ